MWYNLVSGACERISVLQQGDAKKPQLFNFDLQSELLGSHEIKTFKGFLKFVYELKHPVFTFNGLGGEREKERERERT